MAHPAFTIRVERPGIALAATMAEMRSWLDRHMVQPVEFKIERTEELRNIAFDIQFRSKDEAARFAQVFA